MTRAASPDRSLAGGMLAIALFAAVAGAARVAQDAAIAWRYGTGPLVDAYYFVVGLLNWPATVALSTLTLLVAPTEAAQRSADPAERRAFRAELLGGVLVAALLSLPLALWLLPWIAGGPLGGLQPAAAALAVAAVPALAAGLPLGLVSALLAAWLVAAGQRLLTLVEALPPLVLAAALLLLPGTVLFWATTAGAALSVAVLALLVRAGHGLPAPRLGAAAPAWQPFIRGALALLAGQMLFALVPLVDPFFASRLGAGTVAALSFANRLVLGVQGLAGLALQRAGLPLLSQLAAADPARARRLALRWALAAGAGGVAIGAGVALAADPLVSLLFERGRFDAADRSQVALLLRWGMLQMPPFLAGLVLVTALASARGGVLLAAAASAGLAGKVAASALLVPPLGVRGLLLATALMYAVTALLAWWALGRTLRRSGT